MASCPTFWLGMHSLGDASLCDRSDFASPTRLEAQTSAAEKYISQVQIDVSSPSLGRLAYSISPRAAVDKLCLAGTMQYMTCFASAQAIARLVEECLD